MSIVIFVKIKVSFFTCAIIVRNMPLVYQQNINEDSKLGVWHIAETERFFSENFIPVVSIKNEQKRIQHLAGRFLLKFIEPDFPLNEILVAENGMPYLENASFRFSISHCDDHVAVIINKNKNTGIDIESVKPKIEIIKDKFLTKEDVNVLNEVNADQFTRFTLGWTIKESMFKWYGKGGVDFRKNLKIKSIKTFEEGINIDVEFIKDELHQHLKIKSKLFKNIVLSWVE